MINGTCLHHRNLGNSHNCNFHCHKEMNQHLLIHPSRSQMQTLSNLDSLALIIATLILQTDEPAPPDAPKPKPSPNPKQPDSTANLGNFGLHSTRTTLRTSSLYWVQESLGSRTEMQTLIKEAWDTRPEILHLQ
ncbi:uncharacterized protein LOC103880626 isoform X3 [Papio anubis]|uniref:uncharacterized protein LOC103880626 isoform X3 n=1 Tax=Papio anubis TaxID=9555 RepID=UPI0012AD31D2|nr:uncharacterized protein LOC103880626 isoform X3 [Papio anubis]